MKILIGERTLQFTNDGLKKWCEKKGKPIFFYRQEIDDRGHPTGMYVCVTNGEIFKYDEPLNVYLGDRVECKDYLDKIYSGIVDGSLISYDCNVSSEERCDPDLIFVWEEFGDSIFDSGRIEVVEIGDTKKFKIAFDYDTNHELVLIDDGRNARLYEPLYPVENLSEMMIENTLNKYGFAVCEKEWGRLDWDLVHDYYLTYQDKPFELRIVIQGGLGKATRISLKNQEKTVERQIPTRDFESTFEPCLKRMLEKFGIKPC